MKVSILEEWRNIGDIMVNKLIFVFILHYIGDFLLQTRWMGENKSKNIVALLMHIIVYSATLIPFGFKFAIINGILHLITDFITSKLSSRAYLNKNMAQFWAIIGFDQLVHTITLILTLQYFIGFI